MQSLLRRSLTARIIAVSAIPSATVMVVGLALLIRRADVLEASRPGSGFQLLYQGAIFGTLIVLGCAAAGVLVTMRLLFQARLERLRKVMRRAADGEVLVRAKIDGEDELAELSKDFNTMLARLTDLKASALEHESAVAELTGRANLQAELGTTNRRLEARVRELSLLIDVARSLNRTLELHQVLPLVCRLLGDTLGFQECTVLLAEPDGALVVKASFGYPPGATVEGMRLAPGTGVTSRALLSGELQLVRDISLDASYVGYPGEPARVGSFLALPMTYRSEHIGVLTCRRTRVDAFADAEFRLLGSVAQQATLAIANARLYEVTRAQSLTDPLTNVMNRRAVLERLDLELARAERHGERIALVYLDLDHLKKLNGAHGHLAGDAALTQFASVIAKNIRKNDAVARIGGDEFILVLPQLDGASGLETADKLRRLVEATRFELPGGVKVSLTLSAGVAVYPTDARDRDGLVRAADDALNEAKKAGRNRVLLHARAPTHAASA